MKFVPFTGVTITLKVVLGLMLLAETEMTAGFVKAEGRFVSGLVNEPVGDQGMLTPAMDATRIAGFVGKKTTPGEP
jgi:hypothetical protein